MRITRRRIALALLPLIAACGGSDGGGDDALPSVPPDDATEVFAPDGPIVNACMSPYYQELAGLYDGQISYDNRLTPEDDTCSWEVEMGLEAGYDTDPVNRAFCDIGVSMTSEKIAGGDECGDVGLAADLYDDLRVPRNPDQWIDVAWPVSALVDVLTPQPGGIVYPVGEASSEVQIFEMIFDGNGNISYPDSLTPDSEWTGVLVKQ